MPMNQLSPEARRLFQLARQGDEPSPTTLNRIERVLASRLASGVGIAAGSASALWAQSASGVLLGTTKAISIAVIAGAAAAIGVWVWQSPTPTTDAPVTVVAPSREVRKVESRGDLQPVAAATASEAPAALAATTSSSPGPVALRTAARPAVSAEITGTQPPDTTDQLLEETRELRRAQQALRSGNFEWALKLLKQQDQTFNHGALQEERSAARVLALCQSGQRELAGAEAARFERHWPKSALLARVRSSCW